MKTEIKPKQRINIYPCLKESCSISSGSNVIVIFTSERVAVVVDNSDDETVDFKIGTVLNLTFEQSLEFEPFEGVLELSND